MNYLLGVDLGTSGTKTVLFDEQGTVIASALREYPLMQPKNGWAEQDPDLWWQASAETIREVIEKSGIRGSEIASLCMDWFCWTGTARFCGRPFSGVTGVHRRNVMRLPAGSGGRG